MLNGENSYAAMKKAAIIPIAIAVVDPWVEIFPASPVAGTIPLAEAEAGALE
jgi:hypothetical protein